MIEGIEVLNKTEIMNTVFPKWMGPTIIICAIVCLLIGLIGSIYDGDFEWFTLFLLVGFFLCGTICLIGFGGAEAVPSGRYRYEATISETANFKDISDNYNIIEQRGDIYVLEEKEPLE